MIVNLLREEQDLLFSQNYACEDCGISIEELTPRMFSFNNPFGACPTCTGLGSQLKVDPDLIVPDRSLSILDGAIQASGWNNIRGDGISRMYFDALAKKYRFSLDSARGKDLPQGGQRTSSSTAPRGRQLELHYDQPRGKGVLLRSPLRASATTWSAATGRPSPTPAKRELEELMSRVPLPGLPREAAEEGISGGHRGRT